MFMYPFPLPIHLPQQARQPKSQREFLSISPGTPKPLHQRGVSGRLGRRHDLQIFACEMRIVVVGVDRVKMTAEIGTWDGFCKVEEDDVGEVVEVLAALPVRGEFVVVEGQPVLVVLQNFFLFLGEGGVMMLRYDGQQGLLSHFLVELVL